MFFVLLSIIGIFLLGLGIGGIIWGRDTLPGVICVVASVLIAVLSYLFFLVAQANG